MLYLFHLIWQRGMSVSKMTTGEFLAIKFPGIPESWLKRVSRKLGLLKEENGGNVEMCTRWSNGTPQWTDWKQRDISHDK